MAKPSTAASDQAIALRAGTFSGNAQHSTAICIPAGKFNLTLSGAGTVQLERSFDGGSTWFVCARDSAGNLASWAVSAGVDLSVVCEEPEEGVNYRLTVTAFTSTITYRISR